MVWHTLSLQILGSKQTGNVEIQFRITDFCFCSFTPLPELAVVVFTISTCLEPRICEAGGHTKA